MMILRRISALVCKVLVWVAAKFAPKSVSSVMRKVNQELDIALTHWESAARAEEVRARSAFMKLHLGCGPNVKKGWVNVDFHVKADLHLDLRRPLPFPDNAFELIYSEHLVEHLAYPGEVEFFLAENLRILKPGGVFSVGVPDMEWPIKEYAAGRHAYFEWNAKQSWSPKWAVTPMDIINYGFRQQSEIVGHQHLYAYDFETLRSRLLSAGFASCVRREFDSHLDSEERRVGTLYCSAAKLV